MTTDINDQLQELAYKQARTADENAEQANNETTDTGNYDAPADPIGLVDSTVEDTPPPEDSLSYRASELLRQAEAMQAESEELLHILHGNTDAPAEISRTVLGSAFGILGGIKDKLEEMVADVASGIGLRKDSATRQSDIMYEVLTSANNAVNGARQENYGTPAYNFTTIAGLWNVYLTSAHVVEPDGTIGIRPEQVAIMLSLLKIARLNTSPTHRDSWVDIAGYAACGAAVAESMESIKDE